MRALLVLLITLCNSQAVWADIYKQHGLERPPLKFKAQPDKIITAAKQGKYLNIAFYKKTVSVNNLAKFAANQSKKNQAAVTIGIVVKEAPQEIIPYVNNIKQWQRGPQGFAHKHGAFVSYILPVTAPPGSKYKNGQHIQAGQVLIFINDFSVLRNKNKHYPASWQDAKPLLAKAFKDGRHLVNYKLYMEGLNRDIARLKREDQELRRKLILATETQIILKNYGAGLSEKNLSKLATKVVDAGKRYKLADGKLNHRAIYQLAKSLGYL